MFTLFFHSTCNSRLSDSNLKQNNFAYFLNYSVIYLKFRWLAGMICKYIAICSSCWTCKKFNCWFNAEIIIEFDIFWRVISPFISQSQNIFIHQNVNVSFTRWRICFCKLFFIIRYLPELVSIEWCF